MDWHPALLGLLVLACDSNARRSAQPSPRTREAPVASGRVNPPAAPEPVVPPAPSARADAGAPVEEWTAREVDRASSTQGVARLVALRHAAQAGYDRVVFEFEGVGLPGAHVEYVDRPVRRCGSGDVTEIAGDGWLSVTLEPAAAHTEAGAATVAPRERQVKLPIVREIEMTCDFEAQVTVVLGVESPNRYRVLALEAPTRLVVDVRH